MSLPSLSTYLIVTLPNESAGKIEPEFGKVEPFSNAATCPSFA